MARAAAPPLPYVVHGAANAAAAARGHVAPGALVREVVVGRRHTRRCTCVQSAVELVGHQLRQTGQRALAHSRSGRCARRWCHPGRSRTQMPQSPGMPPAQRGTGRNCASRVQGRRRAAAIVPRKDRRRSAHRGLLMVPLPMPCRQATRRCGSPRGCGDRCRSGRCCVHRVVDVGVARFGVCGEQRRRGHDLAGLAIAALRHVELHPGQLHRMASPSGAGLRWW